MKCSLESDVEFLIKDPKRVQKTVLMSEAGKQSSWRNDMRERERESERINKQINQFQDFKWVREDILNFM